MSGNRWWRQCASKRWYATAEEAYAALDEMAQKGRQINTLNAYDCPFCDSWHVGHRS